MSRYDILHRIEQLDPLQDHAEIYHLVVCDVGPPDMLALLNQGEEVFPGAEKDSSGKADTRS